jgi:hypothetical protein
MLAFRWTIGLGGVAILASISGAAARDVYTIGMAAGLTGYAATRSPTHKPGTAEDVRSHAKSSARADMR